LDGISLPAVPALTGQLPGQLVVDPGVLVLGQTGDTITRPAWAKNGSFFAYRQFTQLVPEFNKFLADNPIVLPGLPRDQGSELLGARFFGRWKSGAPVDISPTKDDPALAANPQENNNFDFSKVCNGPDKLPLRSAHQEDQPSFGLTCRCCSATRHYACEYRFRA